VHRDTHVASRPPRETGGRILKWSDIAAPDLPAPEAVRNSASGRDRVRTCRPSAWREMGAGAHESVARDRYDGPT
jgi:hypothetical protein